jgi:hypothetical protein
MELQDGQITLHGADSDIALNVRRNGCDEGDHSDGHSTPDKLFHFVNLFK